MDQVTIRRGSRNVTFTKSPDYFALRLKRGRPRDAMALEADCGRPASEVTHIDSVVSENMEVFAVKEPAKLEETTNQLRQAPAADVVSHVYTLDNIPGGMVIPTGTMTIQFRPEVTDEKREEILAEFGLEVLKDLDFLPHGYTVRLTQASKENPLKIAAKLQHRSEIVTAEPDLAFRASPKHAPMDTLYREQWHLKNRGDIIGLVAGADVKAEEAWELSHGKRDIIVCIMDDGFDLTHPDLNAQGKIIAPRDFGDDDVVPDPGADTDNHGTACAGVAIAEENGSGVVGLAPSLRIHARAHGAVAVR